MSHHPSRTSPWHARHATDSPTHTSATSYPTAKAGPESDPSTAPTGTAPTNQAGHNAAYPAPAAPDTTCGPATAAPASTHPNSDPTAASSTAHNPATKTKDAPPTAERYGRDNPVKRFHGRVTRPERRLLHDIVAGHSLGHVRSDKAVTCAYATPKFPSYPGWPDSGGSQEFFLGGSENFGGMAW